MRLLTASAVRWGRGLVAGAAVVAAGAASRVTEGGADRRREREACKHTRDYLAPGELHTLSPFLPQLSAWRLTPGGARHADAADAIRTRDPTEVKRSDSGPAHRRVSFHTESLRRPGTDAAFSMSDAGRFGSVAAQTTLGLWSCACAPRTA
jgi:hypothetical protein